MSLQQCEEFFLETHLLMMSVLISYISNDRRNKRRTHTECPIAPLPLEFLTLLARP